MSLVNVRIYDAKTKETVEIQNLPESIAEKMRVRLQGLTFLRVAQDAWEENKAKNHNNDGPYIFFKNLEDNKVFGLSWNSFPSDLTMRFFNSGVCVLCDYESVVKETDDEESLQLMKNLWSLHNETVKREAENG